MAKASLTSVERVALRVGRLHRLVDLIDRPVDRGGRAAASRCSRNGCGCAGRIRIAGLSAGRRARCMAPRTAARLPARRLSVARNPAAAGGRYRSPSPVPRSATPSAAAAPTGCCRNLVRAGFGEITAGRAERAAELLQRAASGPRSARLRCEGGRRSALASTGRLTERADRRWPRALANAVEKIVADSRTATATHWPARKCSGRSPAKRRFG